MDFLGCSWMQFFCISICILKSFNTCSRVWLNSLCLHHADFFKFHTRPQQEREVVTWRTSRKKLGQLSILQSSKFNSVVFQGSSPTLFHWLLQRSSPLRTLHVARDTNFDGLSIAVVSHAFNSSESVQNSMISLSLRSSTPLALPE